jgi:surfeit locus 1 family protein
MRADRAGPLARPALTIATLLALAVLIGLGVWQLQRLQWKQGLVARLETAQRASETTPPTPVVDALREAAAGYDVEFRRVTLPCRSEPEGVRYARVQHLLRGELGDLIVYPCSLATGPYRTLLVVSEFRPSDTEATTVVCLAPGRSPQLVGILRRGGRRNVFTPDDEPAKLKFYARNIEAIASTFRAPAPAPYMAVVQSTPECGDQGELVPVQISNNHLGYAITWFGLAAVLVTVYWALIQRDKDRA